MMRACQKLLNTGKKNKAQAMAQQFFKSFPHTNFPYDDSVMPFIDVLSETGDNEGAMKHMEILATELYQRLKFYDSLSEEDVASFKQDYGYALRGTQEIMQTVDRFSDKEYVERIKAMINQYDVSSLRNRG